MTASAQKSFLDFKPAAPVSAWNPSTAFSMGASFAFPIIYIDLRAHSL